MGWLVGGLVGGWVGGLGGRVGLGGWVGLSLGAPSGLCRAPRLGRHLAALPCHPRLGKILVLGGVAQGLRLRSHHVMSELDQFCGGF